MVILRRHPLAAVVVAVGSHFILDAIPHWHYPIPSLKRDLKNPSAGRFVFDRVFAGDILKTGLDCLLGFVAVFGLSLWHAPQAWPWAILGASLGVLPDLLQFIYYASKGRVFPNLHLFHKHIHTLTRLDDQPLLGIGARLGLALICGLTLVFLS